jgi:hypothetical protein
VTAPAQSSGTFELFSLLRDRRFWRGPAVWVLLLLAINVVVAVWRSVRQDEAVAASAAAQGRFALDPKDAKKPVRYDWSCGEKFELFLSFIPDSRKTHLVITSGMSMMYTINDYQPTDQTIPEWMDDALAPQGTRVFGLAAPNLSHEESIFLLLTTLEKPETHPDVFIFAVAFEKLREVDLRRQYATYLRKHPELIEEWRNTALRYRAKYPLASEKMLSTLEQKERDESVNEASFESRLRRGVSSVSPFVAERRMLNSMLRIRLFAVRNFFLGIKNTTKRPIIRDRYDTNREFLRMLVDLGEERGAKVLLFIVPFNPSAENPYIMEEYVTFKSWLEEFAREKRTPLANLENVVPSTDWGLFLGGPDFKHFRGEGHRKTAAALIRSFPAELTAPAQTGAAGR